MNDHRRIAETEQHEHRRISDPLLASIIDLVTSMDRKLDRHMEGEEGVLEEIRDEARSHRDEIRRQLDSFMQSINSYVEKINGSVSELNSKTVQIEGAFPDKDLKAHHDEHKEARRKGEIWRIRFMKWGDDLGGWVLKLGLIFLAVALWDAFKGHLK